MREREREWERVKEREREREWGTKWNQDERFSTQKREKFWAWKKSSLSHNEESCEIVCFDSVWQIRHVDNTCSVTSHPYPGQNHANPPQLSWERERTLWIKYICVWRWRWQCIFSLFILTTFDLFLIINMLLSS